MANKRASSAPLVRIFVRIGALRRFHTLTRKTAELPVEVSWDRRRSRDEAGAANPSGGAERRQKPPFTWEAADFVVVENPQPDQEVLAKRR